VFGLIDGNSFYCECERAFDPKLRGKPLVVLSNNDGCAISRTREAKDLGVRMGDPYHLVAKRPELKPVIWKSSNYALYGDMSRRMYEVLCEMVPQVEPYSIDEMFLDLRGMPWDLVKLATEIRAAVRQIAKIPTCVGIGPTKTLAKLANKVAKGERHGSGICDFSTPEARSAKFPQIPLGDVWGMGGASVEKLAKGGIRSVADFVALPLDEVRKTLTVTGLRTHAELRGLSCYPFSLNAPTRQTIACTRSFGRMITEWEEMRQAVVTYVSRAAEKLRRHGLRASAMQVFMHTNLFNKDPRYSNQVTVAIEPASDTFALIGAATRAAQSMWRKGYRYQKAGIVLIDLYQPQDMPVQDMFASRDPVKSKAIMAALDAVNARFGRGTLQAGIIGKTATWGMRRANLSPCYTTRLDDLLQVNSGPLRSTDEPHLIP